MTLFPLPYFDAHCDTLSRCLNTGEDLLRTTGQCDLTRLSAYRPAGQLFAIYHDAAHMPPEGLFRRACRQQALFQSARGKYPELMTHAALSVEGAELLDCDPDRLEIAAAWGVRSVNLTWNHANALSGSHLEQPERGLSDVGRAFARRAYALGILLDVSHLSDPGFWDLVRIAEGPLFASHSNSRAVCPHTRNLTDDQFRAIRDSGGVVGLNLYRDFVGPQGTMEELVAHVEHFLNLGGEKTLCLGGDLDGCEALAAGMQGMQDMPKLYAALRERGYGQALLEDIFWNNLRRLL